MRFERRGKIATLRSFANCKTEFRKNFSKKGSNMLLAVNDADMRRTSADQMQNERLLPQISACPWRFPRVDDTGHLAVRKVSRLGYVRSCVLLILG